MAKSPSLRWTCRTGNGGDAFTPKVPQASLRHGDIQFLAEYIPEAIQALLARSSDCILQYPPNEDEIRAAGAGFQHVFAGPYAAVEEHREIVSDGRTNYAQRANRARRTLQLTRTVARNMNGVDTCIPQIGGIGGV